MLQGTRLYADNDKPLLDFMKSSRIPACKGEVWGGSDPLSFLGCFRSIMKAKTSMVIPCIAEWGGGAGVGVERSGPTGYETPNTKETKTL